MSNFIALVVEDDAFQREALTEMLRSEGLEVVECATGAVAELVLVSTRHRTPGFGDRRRTWRGDVLASSSPNDAKIQSPNLNVVIISGRDPPYLPQDARFLYEALSGTGATRRRAALKLHDTSWRGLLDA